MNVAKIHLSPQESELISNREWLLVKNQVIDKIITVFGELHQLFKQRILEYGNTVPQHISPNGGKISKGNNFNGLPFVVLDYPANFEKGNIFCVRCFFLWGNYFIISLHLSGKYMPREVDHKKWLTYFNEKNFKINISPDEWSQEWFCYEKIEINKKQLQQNFLKVAAKTNINDWEKMPEFFLKKFNEIISFVCLSCHLSDEKVP